MSKRKQFSKNRQYRKKLCIFAGEMYPTICVNWTGNHFGVGLTQIDPILTKIYAKKTIVTFSFQ